MSNQSQVDGKGGFRPGVNDLTLLETGNPVSVAILWVAGLQL